MFGEPPELAKDYEFKSLEVKELAFWIDGVFISTQLSCAGSCGYGADFGAGSEVSALDVM